MPPPDKLGQWRVYECDWHDEPWHAVGDWQAARHLADFGHEPRFVDVLPSYALARVRGARGVES
jgi:hypothetical protein